MMEQRKIKNIYKTGLRVIVGIVLALLLGLNMARVEQYNRLLAVTAFVVTLLWVVVFALLSKHATPGRGDESPAGRMEKGKPRE
jgi:lipopolysaccharide export LptBFGC system permease protein LptF